MRHRIYPGILTVVLFFLITACREEESPSSQSAQPNVLFIMVDDLRPTLGCYRDSIALTPNIDKLAEKGVVFSRAYCQQAVCNPSRASILTGLRPDQDGVTDLKTNFREKVPDVVTLPQIFKNNGYLSVDVGKIFHDAQFAQDSLSWSYPPIYNYNAKKDQYFLPQHRQGGKATAAEFADVPDDYYIDGKIADAAMAWLDRFQADKQSFFLALGFKKPHLPFCAPKKYWDMYKNNKFSSIQHISKPAGAPEIAFHNWQELRGYKDIPDSGALALSEIDSLRHSYYACVSFVDTQIGKVINKLHDLGLDKNTVIVLLGDNGYHLAEQDLWCKATNFELDNRIPFIMSAPGISPANKSCKALVEALDIYPTLIDLCHIKMADSLAGRSLKPLLANTDAKWQDAAFSQFTRPYGALFSKFSQKAKYMGYSVRIKDWRYTAWYNLQTDSIDYRELYNLAGNSIEAVNVSGEKQYKSIESKFARLTDNYRNGNIKNSF